MPENQSPAAQRQRRRSDIIGMGLLILLLPILLVIVVPMVIVVGGIYLLVAVFLHIAVLLLWLPRGRRLLFVYSNSPIWQAYIEAEILPRLPPNAKVLNWSNRKHWPRFSLSTWLFKMFAGSREFNPIAIVFRPWAPPERFRFWRAFRDYKHGKPERLRHHLTGRCSRPAAGRSRLRARSRPSCSSARSRPGGTTSDRQRATWVVEWSDLEGCETPGL